MVCFDLQVFINNRKIQEDEYVVLEDMDTIRIGSDNILFNKWISLNNTSRYLVLFSISKTDKLDQLNNEVHQ